MDTANAVLDNFLEPVRESLTREQARRLVEFRLDPSVQAHIAELAAKSNEGELTPQERAEYEGYVEAGDMIALLQAKARQILDYLPP
jgi:hypothetical protein